MSKFRKIFISCCCTLMILLIVPFSIFAEEETVYTFIYHGEVDPNTVTYPRYLVPSLNLNTSDSCDKVAELSEAQFDAAFNNYYNKNINLIYVYNTEFYIGKGIWLYVRENGIIDFNTNGGVADNGIYKVNTDGSLGSKLDVNSTINIDTLLLWQARYGGNQDYLLANYNVLNESCPVFQTYDVILNSSPNDGGTTTGGGTYNFGDNVTIEATPNFEFRFKSWSDGVTTNPRLINVSSNITLTAIFESTVFPPNLNLPTPNEPNYSVDVEQNQIISTNGSPGIRGGQIYSFNVDYYNIYSVVQTAETDEFFSNRNKNYYSYQLKDGKYIFPVYQYSELTVFAPNMNVSGAYIPIEIKYSELIPEYSYIILADDSNVIQRDVSSFSTKYIDSNTSDVYSFDNLPFSNSSNNENHLEYLGTAAEGGYTNFNASSVSIELSFNRGIFKTLYFVITDTTNSIENAQMMTNQATINNNMIKNFENVNNSIVSGTSNSQQVESSNNQSNQLLDNTISSYDELEQGFKNDLDDHLGDLDIDFKFGSITDFTKTASFVRTQFDNITSDNPFGLLIGFSLAVGISLLIIGKRL